MTKVLFAAEPEYWAMYRETLGRAFADAGIKADVSPDIAPDRVDYIVYSPNSGLSDFSGFPRLKAVFSLWAGVERIVGNPTLQVPLTRMVDDGLRQGMVEWVTGHVLRHHLGMDAQIVNPGHEWAPRCPPLAKDRPVTILGLGALGEACAQALIALGFPVTGWSRTRKAVEGVTCLSGADGLDQALRDAQIVVLLLPDTQATQNVLDARTLALLPKGAMILNPGRGPLIDDDALIAALDAGQIGHATLDVFRTEPLPRGHPFWAHPKVTVTPHIASETRADTSSANVAENLRRAESGEPLLNLVDRDTGY